MPEGVAVIDAGVDPDASRNARPHGAGLGGRLAAGEPEALDELVALYGARVTRLVHRLLGWRGDVDDVVQDVFLAALTHGRRFRGDSSVATWLTVIAINTCRSRRRGLRALWRRFAPHRPDVPNPLAAVAAEPDSGGDAETSARVRRAVQALAPPDREVVVLRYFDQMSLDEIAAATGRTKNAVEVRLHRARAKLALTLNDLVGEDRRP